MLLTDDVEPLYVLSCDISVRADINDIDAWYGVLILETFNRFGNHTTGDETLTKSGLIGHEEPTDWLVGVKEAT